MIRSLLLSAIAALTFALPAGAQINLAWNDCFGVGSHTGGLAYACDGSRNGQPYRAVLSFVCPDSLPAFVGFAADILIMTDAATIPDFWRLGTGECRQGNLAFPTSLEGVGTGVSGSCRNPWLGANTGGGFQYTSQYGLVSHARLQLAFARDTEAQLSRGVHYLAGAFTLDTWKDVDVGSAECAGCRVGACLLVREVELYQTAGTPPYDVIVLASGAVVTWHAAFYSHPLCVTPTRRTSWGSVKATYR